MFKFVFFLYLSVIAINIVSSGSSAATGSTELVTTDVITSISIGLATPPDPPDVLNSDFHRLISHLAFFITSIIYLI